DLFQAFTRYFDAMLHEIMVSENKEFYKNLFLNLDFRSSDRVSPEVTEKRCPAPEHRHEGEGHKIFLELIATENLKISGVEEVKQLFGVLITLMFTTLTETFRRQRAGKTVSYEETQASFRKKMMWLQY